MDAYQPNNFRRNLFPHQLENIKNMENLEALCRVKLTGTSYIKTHLGILADKTGYGKTASIIGLLVRNKMEWDTEIKHKKKRLTQFSKNNLIIIKEMFFYTKVNCNLILVPEAIAFQWEEELNYSDLKFLIVNQTRSLKRNIKNIDVVVVTPKFFNLFLDKYRNIAWKRFIFDEPGNIKVPGMHEVIAGFYWFVTATIGRVFQTHNKCITSFMHSFLTGYKYDWWMIDKLTIKNPDELLSLSFIPPPISHKEYFTSNRTFSIVKNYASNIITRMIESGDIGGALEALGGRQSDNLFELLKMTKENKVSILKDKIEKCKTDPKNQKIIEKYVNEIRKLEIQISEIQNKYETLIGTDCMICYEPLKNPVMEPVCEALFCGTCFLTWLKEQSTCPHCRSEVDTSNIYYVETEKNETFIFKDKLDVIFEILENKPEGKFIIFASHDQSFRNIISALQNKCLPFIQAKGSVQLIEKNIKRFKAGEINILLLNSVYNGAGINLQEATDIILYHKMDTNTEVQVIGRADRIGRKEPLTVHHLLYK